MAGCDEVSVQIMFVAFAVAGAVWVLVVLRSRQHAQWIHHLMGVLIAAKTLTLLSQAGMFLLIQGRGRPDGWNLAYYVFTFLRGLLLFTVNFASPSSPLVPLISRLSRCH